MRILVYHPVRLPTTHYGGTERVVMWLVKTLCQLGHSVSVFAGPGSSMPEQIECITDEAVLKKRSQDFDIVHSFTKLSTEWYARFHEKVLVTIEGNGQPGEKFHRNTVFVSKNHAIRHGATEFVYNGLDPDELLFQEGPRPDRFLFLSKTSWKVKNLKGAMILTNRYQKNLWIAGGDQPYFFRALVMAKRAMGVFARDLSRKGHDWKWIGSVNQEQKAKFLISGSALVFPLLWNEPFGLVITEALVSGTPVLAHPYGSVPELLEFAPQCLMHSEADWARAFRGEIQMPSARNCRDWVLAHFELEAMTRKYLSLYERVASGKVLHVNEPVTVVGSGDLNTNPLLEGGL